MPNEKTQPKKTNDILAQVVGKIENANNILVAVSKDPTADELSAALGLTIMLDEMGKHATAIYSGKTPDALQFLNPEKTFESNTNSLQDFIIALDKEKADHLRYKVDGDFVKVFITPYKTTLDESDLKFSHGDFNVDLVIALDVPTTDDLDAALYEHGRIMHDAGSINVTNGVPGKFGEIEWNDQSVSSVSEMISNLAFEMKDKIKVDKTVATALLTGIVANTDRFLNDNTTPKTMDVAGKLMQLGANQQLISSNFEDAAKKQTEAKAKEESEGGLEVENEGEGSSSEEKGASVSSLDELAEKAAKGADGAGVSGDDAGASAEGELNLRKDGGGEEKNEDSAGSAGLTPEEELNRMIAQPVTDATAMMTDLGSDALDSKKAEDNLAESGVEAPAVGSVAAPDPELVDDVYPKVEGDVNGVDREEAIKEPEPQVKDYGKMMEDELSESLPNPAAQVTPAAPTGPELNHIPEMDYVPHAQTTPVTVPTMNGDYLSTEQSGGGVAEAPQVAPMMPEMMQTPAPMMPEMAQPEAPQVQASQPEMMQPEALQVPQPEMMQPEALQMPQPEMMQVPTPVMPEIPQPEIPQPVVPGPVASEQSGQTASQLEQANDPSAFRIPGM